MISIEREMLKTCSGKQVVVEECIEHPGERRHRSRHYHGKHLVAEGVDAGRPRRLLILTDRQPEIADAAAQENMAEHESEHGRDEDDVIKHGRRAAQLPQIVVRVLLDRQKQAARGVDIAPIVEADAGEFGKCDGQDREIDAGDAEAKGEKADDCSGTPRLCGMAASRPSQGATPNCVNKHRRNIGAQPEIEACPSES